MPTIPYGTHTITYTFEQKKGLKNHYIIIKKGQGVILRGRPQPEKKANEIILKKAPWILKKLEQVGKETSTDIVTGSKMPYLGSEYEVEIILDEGRKRVALEFTGAIFRISLPESQHSQENLQKAFEAFYRAKAKELITPRVQEWSRRTGLAFGQLRFKRMKTRWGSCSYANNINLNIYAMKLPMRLIDYLIVHELSHTRVKNHSKDFWAEVARHMPGWKPLDKELRRARI